MSLSQIQKKYIIQSKINNQNFEVDYKVINASELLKNICALTKIFEPIIVSCHSKSLEIFIKLISHYDIITNEHDYEFETNIYQKFNDNELAELIQDLCIVDSDFFLDSIADFMLRKFAHMKWEEIQEYLGVENDFTLSERYLIEKYQLEYFLGIDVENAFTFPFQNKNFHSLKTTFASPMNALLARIIQRSDEKVSNRLSLINKTIKNEINRNSVKLTEFKVNFSWWYLQLNLLPIAKDFSVNLCMKTYNQKYFEIIKEKKVKAKIFSLSYGNDLSDESGEKFMSCSSMNLAITYDKNSQLEVLFCDAKYIHYFNVTECPFQAIIYKFHSVRDSMIKFDYIYKQLVSKDLSKEIVINICGMFKLIPNGSLYKKLNASKFYKYDFNSAITVLNLMKPSCTKASQFKNIVMNYMDDNGIILTSLLIDGIPEKAYTKFEKSYEYKVVSVIPYLRNIL